MASEKFNELRQQRKIAMQAYQNVQAEFRKAAESIEPLKEAMIKAHTKVREIETKMLDEMDV